MREFEVAPQNPDIRSPLLLSAMVAARHILVVPVFDRLTRSLPEEFDSTRTVITTEGGITHLYVHETLPKYRESTHIAILRDEDKKLRDISAEKLMITIGGDHYRLFYGLDRPRNWNSLGTFDVSWAALIAHRDAKSTQVSTLD